MPRRPVSKQEPYTMEQYNELLCSYKRSLAAANLSNRTIGTYSDTVRDFGSFLAAHNMPLTPSAVERIHIEAFINSILQGVSSKTGRPYKPATAHNRYRGLQAFFKWLQEMGLVEHSPMVSMRPPKLPDTPPPVLSEEQIKSIFRACDGKSFEERRDTAILRILVDTGARCAEVANLRLQDIDWRASTLSVLGKGRKPRQLPLGKKTVRALDLYVNWGRKRHRDAARPELWLGHEGPTTISGIYQVVRDRAASAGIKCYPHMLRHLAAHRYLLAGGQEANLMRLMGWSSRSMVSRYGASAADERARDEHRRLALGDML